MKRTTSINRISSDEFARIISSADSISGALLSFGLKNIGQNYIALKNRMILEGLDYDQLKSKGKCIGISKLKSFAVAKPLEQILQKDVKYSRKFLKKRLIENGLLKNQCYDCGLKGEWNGKPIVMILDHINGENNDNRIENLRLLCPNCNSQTETFCRKKSKVNINLCSSCGKKICKESKLCVKCSNKSKAKNRRKVFNRPNRAELEKMMSEMSMVAIGKKYGVSDNAVRKWIKSFENIIGA